MIHPAHENGPVDKPGQDQSADPGSVLSVSRIAVGMPASSKKRLLENMADLLVRDGDPEMENKVLQVLIERERLGSTGIGKGVALPHGRMEGLDRAVGAFATLENPIDFDAIDHEPVGLVFALLVPAEATQTHLRLLARLAGMFNDPRLREKLRSASSAEEMYTHITQWEDRSPPPS
jgi:PTS system nitrogen regulatory IIA component